LTSWCPKSAVDARTDQAQRLPAESGRASPPLPTTTSALTINRGKARSMATIEHNTDSASCVPTRRKFLGRSVTLAAATATGALALPAGAAVAAIELPASTDPHLGWWRELQEVRAEFDLDDDDLSDRKHELEDKIAQTPPATPEGAAIVAAMIVTGHARVYLSGIPVEPEDRAGDTLARYLLDRLPADVKRRAGLEG
jgi:hypothetical protein